MSILIERLAAEIDVDPSKAIAALATFDAAVERAAKDRTAHVDIEVDKGQARAQELESILDGVVSKIVGLGGAASSAAGALGGFTQGLAGAEGAAARLGGQAGDLGGKLGGVGGGAASGGTALAGFAASAASAALPLLLMGSAIPYVISAINALIGAAVALVAALAPLVGLLGALPGLFLAAGAGFGVVALGLKGVLGAISAYSGAQNKAAGSGRSAASVAIDRAAAERGLKAALESVTRAQENLKDSEKGLIKAREEARQGIIRNRENLELSILSEEDAVLRLKRAQEDLAKAQGKTAVSTLNVSKQTDYFTGKIYEVSIAAADQVSSQTKLVEAQRAVRTAEIELRRATLNTKNAREAMIDTDKKGINNSDVVVAANRRIRDSHRALAAAIDGVTSAQIRQARQAAGSGAGAFNKYNQAMKKLTPVGREFVRFVTQELLPAFKGIQAAAEEHFLPGFERGLRRLIPLAGGIKNFVRDIAHAIGTAFDSLSKQETQPRALMDYKEIMASTTKVLTSFLGAAAQLIRIFRLIAVAARPLTEYIAEGIHGSLIRLADWMDKHREKMGSFFSGIIPLVKEVTHIFGNLGRVAFNFLKAAKGPGDGLLKTFSDLTDEWVKWSGDAKHQKQLKEWFDKAVVAFKELAGFVGDLVVAFVNIGGKGNPVMKDFSKVVKDIRDALPGVVDMLKDLSQIIGPLATAVAAIATSYKAVTDSVDTAKKSVHTLDALIFGSAVSASAASVRKAKAEEDAAGRAYKAWQHSGSLNTAEGTRLATEWEKSTKRRKDAEKKAADETYFGWSDVWRKVKEGWKTFYSWWVTNVNDPMKRKELEIADWFAQRWEDIKRSIQKKWNEAINWVIAKYEEFRTAIRRQVDFSGIFDGLKLAFKNAMNYIIQAWNGLGFSISVPKSVLGIPVPGGGSKVEFNPGYIAPLREFGGAVKANHPYIVGEKRPELFVPNADGYIRPNLDTIGGNGLTEEQLDRILAKAIENSKAPINIDQTFMEKQDPVLLSNELAWRIR